MIVKLKLRSDVNIPKNTQHQFKYLVNESNWLNDPEADGLLPNEFGGENTLIIL